MVRNNQKNDFNNFNLANKNSILLNTQALNDNHIIKNAYVDQSLKDNGRSRRILGIDFCNESSDLVKNYRDRYYKYFKLTNLDNFTTIRTQSFDEVSNKKYIGDELDKNTILRFNQTLEKYIKVSVGKDVYNLAKNDKLRITVTILI